MIRLIFRRILVKKRPLDERPEKSFVEIFKEAMEIDNRPKTGFAFVHPILGYNYDTRPGRKVITNKGVGEIRYSTPDHYLGIYLDKQKYVIHRHPNTVFIIVVLGEDQKFKPLTFHDWECLQDKLVDRATSFKVEYRNTTHGNYCLTDKFKKECRQSNL